MIKMRDWRVFVPASDQMLGHEADHLLRKLEIRTDLDDGWAVMLDLEKDGQKNILALDLEDGVLSAALTRDMLRSDGTYTAQLRGTCGDVVAHSDQFQLTVCGSIHAVEAFPETGPSYLEALEQRLLLLKHEAEQSAAAAQAAAGSIEGSTQAAQTAAERAETAAGSIGDAAQTAQAAAERAEAARESIALDGQALTQAVEAAGQSAAAAQSSEQQAAEAAEQAAVVQTAVEQTGAAAQQAARDAQSAQERAQAAAERAETAAGSIGDTAQTAQAAADRAEAARESIALDEQELTQAVEAAGQSAAAAQSSQQQAAEAAEQAAAVQTAVEQTGAAAQQAARDAQTAAERAETAAGSIGDTAQTAQAAADRAEAAEAGAAAIVAGNEAYTKGESDIRFARPIVERAAGETIAVTDSMERPLQGLKLFGKTTRNAPPAPDAPAALESAGDSGQILLSVTDGTQENAQTLTLSTPNGLPGLPVASGGNYTDGNGQRWICDEVDFARGKYVQRIHRQPLNGSETWTNGWTNSGAVQRPSITLPFAILRPSDAKTKGIVLCDRFETVSAYETWMETTGISVSHEANVVQFIYAACPTINQWKAYLASNPSSFLVALADPVETELPPETLAQYAALHTNEPSTALFSDGRAGMEVAYAADTKRYLDKRLAAMLAAAGEEGA